VLLLSCPSRGTVSTTSLRFIFPARELHSLLHFLHSEAWSSSPPHYTGANCLAQPLECPPRTGIDVTAAAKLRLRCLWNLVGPMPPSMLKQLHRAAPVPPMSPPPPLSTDSSQLARPLPWHYHGRAWPLRLKKTRPLLGRTGRQATSQPVCGPEISPLAGWVPPLFYFLFLLNPRNELKLLKSIENCRKNLKISN
jgi:hypothetical protein